MWTYGVVGLSVAAVSLIFFAVFYGINLAGYPLAIALGLLFVFLLGVLFRRRRKGLHHQAVATEYASLKAADAEARTGTRENA